jgi:tartrate-resistant acid phosphatase type 5
MFCAFALTASAAQVRFAIIGDYGIDGPDELAVAQLITNSFQPEFVVTVGDNNYLGAANIDDAIGKYYHQFIGNYSGSYGAGATSNRFFPALGNHDWDSTTGYSAHLNYFTLPGNERYYEFVRGPVHFFILNSDSNEPGGNTANSPQALWFSNAVANSTSPWRIAIAQDPPYSSTESLAWMRWPFDDWGAHILVSGDSHQYERIMLNGFPYVVNGAGGAGLAAFGSPIAGSTVRYNAAHGAMKVVATETNITYEFWSVADGGTMIDRFVENAGPRLHVQFTNSSIRVSWPTNGTSAFALQSAMALPGTWTNVAQAPVVSGTRYTVNVSTTGSRAFFRLAQ